MRKVGAKFWWFGVLCLGVLSVIYLSGYSESVDSPVLKKGEEKNPAPTIPEEIFPVPPDSKGKTEWSVYEFTQPVSTGAEREDKVYLLFVYKGGTAFKNFYALPSIADDDGTRSSSAAKPALVPEKLAADFNGLPVYRVDSKEPVEIRLFVSDKPEKPPEPDAIRIELFDEEKDRGAGPHEGPLPPLGGIKLAVRCSANTACTVKPSKPGKGKNKSQGSGRGMK
ncbi:MAG: hypothetical protein GY862_19845 [Gammaproteobacteria bacterium]|nr:hypothetical protein [Gammaproteobacteria bacterium]